MSNMTAEDILKKVQAKIAEQNQVILEQQMQIQEYQQKIEDLDRQLNELKAAEAEKQTLMAKLAELIE